MTRFRAAFLPILLSASIILAMGLMGAPLQPAAAAVGISVPGDYPTIQAAIDAATDGDTIVVAAGTYSGTTNGEVFPIVVNKQVTLLGAQASVDPRPSQGGRSGAETIIDGGESSEAVIQIAASGVVVNGFTITGGTGDIVREYGFSAENKLQGLLFCHNILYDYVEPGDEGIQIAYSDNVIIEYNYGHDLFQDAFSICHSSNGVIRYNEAHDIASENAAIYCYLTTNTDVIGNLVYSVDHGDDAHGNGIQLGDYDDGVTCTGGVIKDNVIHDVAQDGICVERMTGVTVEGNTIYGADSHDGAVNLRTVRSSTFRSNTVYNNDAIGVLIKSSSSLAFSGNSVHHNADTNDIVYPGTAGIWIVEDSDASTISIHCNNIYGNGEYGLKNLDTLHTASASSNWWGAASGPTHPGNPGGTGDAVSGYVSYTPWRTVASGSPMTWNVNPGGSIQTAVDAACPGDIVAVAAGTYAGKVTINKSLTLRGANYGISAGAVPGTRGPESIIQGGMQIGGNGVVVDGLKIDGPASVGTRDGIYIVGGTSGHTISNNVFVGYGTSSADDGWAMVLGHSTANIVVRNNGISNWWSTYVNPTDPSANILFEGNHFHDNYVGIGSDGLNDVNIQHNKFTNNILEGFGTSAVGSDVCAHNNDFAGNGAGINNYDSAGTVDATNNWWGYSSGPSGAGDGDGDAVSSYVDFEPWLGSPVCSPTVTSVDPDSGDQGRSYSVTINGTRLTIVTSVNFGSGVTTTGFTINSDSEITANITIDGAATPGPRDVSVTAPSGTGILTGGFTVMEAPPSLPGWYEQWTAYDGAVWVWGPNQRSQTFTPAAPHYVDIVSFVLYKKGNPNYTVAISLHAVDGNGMPTGAALCSAAFDASSLTGTAAWYVYLFDTGYQLADGMSYALVLSGNGGDANNCVMVQTKIAGGYAGGISGASSDGGLTWEPKTWDLTFREGQNGPPTLSGVTPDQALQGETVYAVISGDLLIGVSSVDFGPGITVDGFTVESDTQITASISVDGSASSGPRDVIVTTTLGQDTLTGGFTVVEAPEPAPPGWYEQWTTYNGAIWVWGPQQRGQTFTPSVSHYLDMAAFVLCKKGNPAYTVTVSLYRVNASGLPSGSALCSTTFPASSLTTAATWYEYGFSTGYQLLAGTQYALVLSGSGGDSNNCVMVQTRIYGGYAGGSVCQSSDGGVTWQAGAYDVAFKEGQNGPPALTGVMPGEALQGETVYVVISGGMLSGATSVDFGPGIVVDAFNVDSGTQISATIIIDESAAVGARDITVTTPLGEDTLIGAFTVLETPGPVAPGWYEQWTTYNGAIWVWGPQQRGQTFTPSVSHYFDMASFVLCKKGNPGYTVTISLHRVDPIGLPTGSPLCSTSFTTSSLTTTPTWYVYGFDTGYQLLEGAQYALVLSGSGGDSNNCVMVQTKIAGGYGGGNVCASSDGGLTWQAAYYDMAFKEGQSGPPALSGVTPDEALPGETVYVAVIGDMLSGATSLDFGPGIVVDSFNVDSGTQITATIIIDGSAGAGPRDVTVITAMGEDTLVGGFSVAETPAPAPPGWYEQQTTYNGAVWVWGQEQRGQTFTPSVSHYFDMVSFVLCKKGNPSYTVTVSLHRVDINGMPIGAALCSTSFAASSLTTTATWYTFTFTTGYQLLAGTQYALVLSGNGGDANNCVMVQTNSYGGYAGGACASSSSGGATWEAKTWDLAFKEGQA